MIFTTTTIYLKLMEFFEFLWEIRLWLLVALVVFIAMWPEKRKPLGDGTEMY